MQLSIRSTTALAIAGLAAWLTLSLPDGVWRVRMQKGE
jgi:hypothetical protein